MFLFKQKHRKKRKSRKLIYYFFAMMMICSGIMVGYINLGQDVVFDSTKILSNFSVAKFSFTKNLIYISLIYLNSFSLVGIPICGSILILNGYMLVYALNSMFLSSHLNKFVFVLRNLPYLTVHIFALILISSVSLEFSKNLFIYVIKSANKYALNYEFKELTLKYFICIILIFFSALYEGYVL